MVQMTLGLKWWPCNPRIMVILAHLQGMFHGTLNGKLSPWWLPHRSSQQKNHVFDEKLIDHENTKPYHGHRPAMVDAEHFHQTHLPRGVLDGGTPETRQFGAVWSPWKSGWPILKPFGFSWSPGSFIMSAAWDWPESGSPTGCLVHGSRWLH